MVLVAGWFALIHKSRELHSKDQTLGEGGNKLVKLSYYPNLDSCKFFFFFIFYKVSIPHAVLENVQVVPLSMLHLF